MLIIRKTRQKHDNYIVHLMSKTSQKKNTRSFHAFSNRYKVIILYTVDKGISLFSGR